jgi:hypothetical protein
MKRDRKPHRRPSSLSIPNATKIDELLPANSKYCRLVYATAVTEGALTDDFPGPNSISIASSTPVRPPMQDVPTWADAPAPQNEAPSPSFVAPLAQPLNAMKADDSDEWEYEYSATETEVRAISHSTLSYYSR